MRKVRYKQWNTFLEELQGTKIWKVFNYIKPKNKQSIIIQIQKEDDTLTTTVAAKRREIGNPCYQR